MANINSMGAELCPAPLPLSLPLFRHPNHGTYPTIRKENHRGESPKKTAAKQEVFIDTKHRGWGCGHGLTLAGADAFTSALAQAVCTQLDTWI